MDWTDRLRAHSRNVPAHCLGRSSHGEVDCCSRIAKLSLLLKMMSTVHENQWKNDVNSCKCKRRIQELFNAALSQLPERGKKSSGCTVNHRWWWCLNVFGKNRPHTLSLLIYPRVFGGVCACSAAALQWQRGVGSWRQIVFKCNYGWVSCVPEGLKDSAAGGLDARYKKLFLAWFYKFKGGKTKRFLIYNRVFI